MFIGFRPSLPNLIIYGLLFVLAGIYIAAEDTLEGVSVS